MKQLLFPLIMASNVVLAGPVDINQADAQTLARELTGVGPKLAERIVEFRAQQGLFPTPDSIQLVPGIGQSIYEKNRDFIGVSDQSAVESVN